MSSDVFKDMLTRTGVTEIEYNSAAAKVAENGGPSPNNPFAPRRGVSDSKELERILALPRRNWQDFVTPEVIEGASAILRNPDWAQHSPPNAKLPMFRPVQVAALADIHDMKGLLGLILVGGGKSLIAFLAPVVLEKHVRNTLLLVPAKLVEKARRELVSYRKNWKIPGYLRIMSYEWLGRIQAEKELEVFKPDLIVADEVHKLKNTRAAVVRRVKRYMEDHQDTMFVGMSGTITKRSIHDYAHIAAWALKRANPVPRDFNTRVEWGLVLDEKPTMDADAGQKLAPGALLRLCNDEEKALFETDPTRAVRLGYRRRLRDTPGVIATSEEALGTSLVIESELLAMPEIVPVLKDMRTKWVRPDGEPIMDAIELWRHIREVACGFWYRWTVQPPCEWKEARKGWAKAVRSVLATNRRGLDSESAIMRAVADGQYPEHMQTLEAWAAAKPTFTPQTEALWISHAMLDYCAKWMESEKGIVWVEHVEFGNALAQKTGVEFYQRGGRNQFGGMIEDHAEQRSNTPMICSIASNAEGRNLQAWNANLVTSAPTSGQIWEQLLGRCHRSGQEADEVTCKVLIAVREQAMAFERARSDARYQADITGQDQKLCYADIAVMDSNDVPQYPTVEDVAKAHAAFKKAQAA